MQYRGTSGTCQQLPLKDGAVIFFIGSRFLLFLAEDRLAAKRCELDTQPLPAPHIRDNGYFPTIDNQTVRLFAWGELVLQQQLAFH